MEDASGAGEADWRLTTRKKPDEGSADIGRERGGEWEERKRRRYLSDQEVEQDLTHF